MPDDLNQAQNSITSMLVASAAHQARVKLSEGAGYVLQGVHWCE